MAVGISARWPGKPPTLAGFLLCNLCCAVVFATVSASASHRGHDPVVFDSSLNIEITATASREGVMGARIPSIGGSTSTRRILQNSSSIEDILAARMEAASQVATDRIRVRTAPTLPQKPAQPAFDPYNDYQAYDYDIPTGGQENTDSWHYDYYEDSFEEEDSQAADCQLDTSGKPVFTGAYKGLCTLALSGANAHVALLAGGLDGHYKLYGCENKRPTYLRQKSPPGEDRLLWYSSKYKDWDITNGTKSNEVDILLYGGEGAGDLQPEFVLKNKWHIAQNFQHVTYKSEHNYIQVDITVKCASIFKATATAPKLTNFGTKPILTPAEMEQQYRSVYAKAKPQKEAANKKSDVILVFVVSLSIAGMMLCLLRRTVKKGTKGGGWIKLVAFNHKTVD